MGAVGLTTRVTGATGGGGFGKTSLARLVAHDPRIHDHYSDGVVWVTVGEDAQGPLLAEKVNEVTARLTGQRPPLTDPVTAGSMLGQVLGGPAAAVGGRRRVVQRTAATVPAGHPTDRGRDAPTDPPTRRPRVRGCW